MGEDAKAVAVVKLGLRPLDLAQLVKGDALLEKAPLFKALGPDDTAALLKGGLSVRLAAGQPVYLEGAPAGGLFLVLKGEVQLTKGNAALGAVQKGEFFGEAELLSPGPRCITATAGAGADVVEFPAAHLLPMLNRVPAAKALLERVQKERARASDELADFLDRW